jgi:hypothetical protein
MLSCSRSEFLRLSSLGTLGLFTSRALALPPGYTGTPSGIRPYLQSIRPDSVWVSWFTATETTGTIHWGTSPDNLSNNLAVTTDTSLGDGYRYHIGRITGLSPNTRYFYRAANSVNSSNVFHFRTPIQDGTKTGHIRVLVAGDNQTYTPERRHEKLIACAKYKIEQLYGVPIEDAIDLVITTGDQVDRGIMLHYRDLHFRFNSLISPYLPIMTTVGNHELYSDPALSNYRKLFRYSELNYGGIISPDPQIYYAYKIGSICFIHTSAEPEHVSTAQTNWIRQVVNALKVDATTDLCVSLVHRPYKAAQGIGDTSAWFANQIMPILAETEKHILTISGHHHYYHRGQTRDWPIYHMVSGGTASTQDWSTFHYDYLAAYDEIQKTHFNWAWQVLDFDLANRKLEVRCFSEAHGRFAESNRWTTQAYNSRLIDSFHRRLGVPAPEKPSITNAFTGALNHPITLVSSPFATNTGEKLNSTWFQLATDNSFINLKLNRIRDVEKIYGDTGLPFLEPVDTHNRIDILTCILPTSLPPGTYCVRTRHRDSNAMWSAWSDVKTFEIVSSVSTAPRISITKSTFGPGETVSVAYENNPELGGESIGIYRKGDTPGLAAAAASQTAVGRQGITTFAPNSGSGEWFAAFLSHHGNTELAPRIAFHVGPLPTLIPSKQNYSEGETVRLDYSNAPGGSKDWIGIYRVDRNPGTNACQAWKYADAASGQVDFPFLPKGYYYAVLMANDGYLELSERVRFSVGSLIARVGMASVKVSEGDPFTVTFSEAPGLGTDWIGLFRNGDTPGQQAEVYRFQVNGSTVGQFVFDLPDLPAGRYWVAMFTNGTHTEVSPRLYFDVIPLVLEETRLENDQMKLRWRTAPGKSYTVQKNSALAESGWIDVQTLTATGDSLQTTLPLNANQPSAYFRIRRN